MEFCKCETFFNDHSDRRERANIWRFPANFKHADERKDLELRKVRILSKSSEKCPICNLGRIHGNNTREEDFNKLWCAIVYPHDYYNKFSRKNISKSRNKQTPQSIQVREVQSESPPCSQREKLGLASRPESVANGPRNTPVPDKLQCGNFSPVVTSISPARGLKILPEVSPAIRYSPDSEYSISRAEYLIEKYVPKPISFHERCMKKRVLMSSDKSDDTVNRKKAMRGVFLKKDIQEVGSSEESVRSVHEVGSLGLTYRIPDYNPKLRQRPMLKTVHPGYNPRTDFLQFSYSRQKDIPPINVGTHTDHLDYTVHDTYIKP
ncbi:hypothetical protein ScPMuIL_012525 [Solemya velum]